MTWKIDWSKIRLPHMCIVFGILAMLAGGCNRQPTQKEQQVRRDAGDTAERVGEAAKETAQKVVKDTTVVAKKTFKGSSKAFREGKVVLRVRAAFALSQRLEGSSITVALAGNKVVLTGTVVSAKQKVIAHQIAVNTLERKLAVVNRLRIAATGKPNNQAR